MVRQPLDTDATWGLINCRHAAHARFDGGASYAHLAAVSTLARKMLVAYYDLGSFIPRANMEWVDAATHAGLLHEAMTFGAIDYDSICDETNLCVADMVGILSPDNRLPRPRRILEVCGRVSQGHLAVKAVKAADLACDVRDARSLCVVGMDASLMHFLGDWVQDSYAYIDAISELFRYSATAKYLEYCQQGLRAIDTALQARHKRDVLAAKIAARKARGDSAVTALRKQSRR